jgi:redox-sensitive bicupin YhaK (pirin superfamily)
VVNKGKTATGMCLSLYRKLFEIKSLKIHHYVLLNRRVYVDTVAKAGSQVPVPHPQMETGVYVIDGGIEIKGKAFGQRDFVLLDSSDDSINVLSNARFVILGILRAAF